MSAFALSAPRRWHDGSPVKPGLEVIKDYSGRDYRTVWQGPRAAFDDRFESRLVEDLVSSAPGWFLDVGAGYGRLYPLYARGGRKVVMVDYALNLLEVAAQAHDGEDDVYFVAANAYHLPFRPLTFAAALSVRVFHHMAHPELFFAELGRVLGSDAHAVVEYSNKRNALRVLRHGRSALRSDHEAYGDLLFGTHPAFFAELAGAAGFTVGQTRGTGLLSRLVTARTEAAAPLVAALEAVLDRVFGSRDLGPVTFAELHKADAPAPDVRVGDELVDILQCPACAGAVSTAAGGIRCLACTRLYPQIGSVYDFRHVAPLEP